MVKSDRIIHRKPNIKFKDDYPRHWLGGNAFKTHFLNSLHLIFPLGEKFFIRSIKQVLPKINDKELRSAVRNFMKQEAQHSLEHDKFQKVLLDQGYDFEKILGVLDFLVQNVLEKIGKEKINVSVTAALEHLTALFSEISLRENFMQDAPDELRELFDWHAAEEIEHRSVAFDVLNTVSKDFGLRIFGIFYAYFILSLFSGIFTSYFLHKDGLLFKKQTFSECFRMFFTQEKLFFKALKIFFRYVDPGFHPSKEDLDGLSSWIFDSYAEATSAA